MADPRRFIGRKSTPCRKCNGIGFYVNRMGGVVCQTCSPPRTAADNCQVLTIEGGVWIDPLDRFDMVSTESAVKPAAVVTPETVTKSQVKNETTKASPLSIQRSRHSRSPEGDLREVEQELFNNPDLCGTPEHCDLIVAYGKHIIWVARMFVASENPERQRVTGLTSLDVKPRKQEALATVLFK